MPELDQRSIEGYEIEPTLENITDTANYLDALSMMASTTLQVGYDAEKARELWDTYTPVLPSYLVTVAEDGTTGVDFEKVKVLASKAVEAAKSNLAMTTDEIKALDNEAQAARLDQLNATWLLVVTAASCAQYYGIDGGKTLFDLDNIHKNITQHDRVTGNRQPAQPKHRETLDQLINDDATKNWIIDATSLNPDKASIIMTNNKVPANVQEALTKFRDAAINDAETTDTILEVYANTLQYMMSIGADVDFIYAINQLPSGEALQVQLQNKLTEQRNALKQIPTLLGLTPEELAALNLDQFGLYQLALKDQALELNEAGLPVVTSPLAIQGFIEEIRREYGVLGVASGNLNVVDAIYGESRSANTTFTAKVNATGEIRAVDIGAAALDGSTPDKARSVIVHENVHALVTSMMETLGMPQSERMDIGLEEQFTQAAEYSFLTNDAASQVPKLVGLSRQVAYAMVNDRVHRMMAEMITANNGNLLTPEQIASIREQLPAIKQDVYGQLYNGICTFKADNKNNIGTVCDGLWYIGDPVPFSPNTDTEEEVEENESEEGEEPATMLKHFGQGWHKNKDARTVFAITLFKALDETLTLDQVIEHINTLAKSPKALRRKISAVQALEADKFAMGTKMTLGSL